MTLPAGPDRFSQYVKAIGEYLIFMNPTLLSPMPRSRIEAAMTGACIVTTNHHDEDMWIKQGVNGYYTNDASEMREMITDLLEHPDKAMQIGRTGSNDFASLPHEPVSGRLEGAAARGRYSTDGGEGMAIRKVGFILVGDRATASARLRGHNVIDFLPECAEQYNPANRDLYQVVVFQKRYEERDIALASDLRNRGKKIVFDMCDNYLSDVRKRPLLERICRIAHVTTTASEQLEELYAPLSNRVVMIADGLLDTAKSKAHGPKFQPVLLWFGNHGERVLGEERGMGDLLMLRKPLEYLAGAIFC